MNETYEKICRFIDWDSETDVDDMKFKLMSSFSKEELEEAKNHASVLYGKLAKAGIERSLSEHHGYYGDSIHDCLSELVAHGEEYVESILENPYLALNRFKDDDYTENFFYVFPSEDEYEYLSSKHYWDTVSQMKSLLRKITSPNVDFDDEELFPVRSFNGNGREIRPKVNHETVKYVAELLEEIWNLKWNSNRDYDTIYKITDELGHGAWFANLWSDMGKYFVRVRPECVIGDGKYRRKPEKV